MSPGELVEVLPVDKYDNNIFPNSISQVEDEDTVIILMLNLSLCPLFLQQGVQVANVECVSACQFPSPLPMIATSNLSPTSDLDLEFERIVRERTPLDFTGAVTDILRQYRDVFTVGNEPTGCTDHMPFHIATGQADPIAQRPYRIPVAHQAAVEEQLKALQKEGIIT